jgi:uracil DNA glycosylase
LDDVSNAEVSTPKSLREMVDQLKSDLGIEASNIKEVIQEAADQLGVEKEEKTLLQLAAECCRAIG